MGASCKYMLWMNTIFKSNFTFIIYFSKLRTTWQQKTVLKRYIIFVALKQRKNTHIWCTYIKGYLEFIRVLFVSHIQNYTFYIKYYLLWLFCNLCINHFGKKICIKINKQQKKGQIRNVLSPPIAVHPSLIIICIT